MNITEETVAAVFTYHAPKGNQVDRYADLRQAGRVLADQVLACCPNSRERSVALTKLQEVVMWANASIAINESESTDRH